jgi:acyl-CoA thioesterase
VELTRQSLNPQGVAHGSLLFALCDCVTGVATASTGRGMLTQSATIHFLRPGSGKRLYARSKLLRNGKNTALCLGEVTDEKGRLLVTSQFEVFYTSDTLTLPTQNADGSWTASQEEGAWKA